MNLRQAAEMKGAQALYRGMRVIREVEQRLGALFAAGELPGFIHLSIGQEAVPVGVSDALLPQDTMASNHRGHGHCLSRGIELPGFFAELMGRQNGVCKGRGGSMHVADLSKGMLGANGIVGAGLSIALGSALAHKLRETGGIAVAYFGDGAVAEGLFHETINLAKLWSLPLLLVCENNGWAEFQPTRTQVAAELPALSGAFGVPCQSCDGCDVLAVRAAAVEMAGVVRSTSVPGLLICNTHRHRGHYEGDPQRYRAKEELASLNAADPILRLREGLVGQGLDGSILDAIDCDVVQEVDAAVQAARAGAAPDLASAMADVYGR